MAVRNAPVYKTVGQLKRRRHLPLNFSLNSTSHGGFANNTRGGSKKHYISFSAAAAAASAAVAVVESTGGGPVRNSNGNGNSEDANDDGDNDAGDGMGGGGAGGVSSKFRGGKTFESINTAGNVNEEAQAAKMSFEKFLLRLEVVALYNTWLTVDQVRTIYWFVLLVFVCY